MKVFEGIVRRATTPKTVFVEVSSYWMHPVYKKKRKLTNTFACQDILGVKVGETVKIGECRPMSKTKRFTVLEKVSKK